jgi:Mn2+/Fe2+ NRAMP family transporter
MADAVCTVIGGNRAIILLAFGGISVLLQVFTPYARYVAVLKWLTLTLFSYILTLFVIHVDWQDVATQTVLPTIRLDKDFLTTIVAILGTTISPYLFFWQASQEAEDLRESPRREKLAQAPDQAVGAFRRIRIDTILGMGFSNVVALAIMIAAAATLGAHHVTQIETSAQAAEALKPIAGEFASSLFALGVIGTGFLAIPVLAGSAAYASAEALHWREGLARQWSEARAFYATLAFATLVGLALNFVPINPIRALFWSAVINGVVAVPVMVLMMKVAADPAAMGPHVVKGGLKRLGWLTAGVMGIAAAGMIAGMVM